MIDVKIKRATEPTPAWPSYATPLSAGADIRSKIDTIVPAHGRVLIPTGMFVAIPEGYEIQVRPRSGLALKKGITVLNTPGTIDADYRNEIGVILFNTTDEDFVVNAGDRIAQIVLTKFEQINWVEVNELDETDRTDGFGHTGLK
jgi:dUTP pyrophosphatase